MGRKSFFFTRKSQRNGIIVLLFLIIATQCLWLFIRSYQRDDAPESEDLSRFRKHLDSLAVARANAPSRDTIYPFNPNYMTDYKGYVLGMRPQEIDRLIAYRKEGKFVRSAIEFQQVTQISDSLLKKLQSYLKFPSYFGYEKKRQISEENKKENFVKQDLNQATAEDLRQVRGVGEVLSKRIIKYRERLQGFFTMDQLHEVFGLEDEVVQRIMKRFEIQTIPQIQKQNINELSVKELAQNPYIGYKQAQAIVMLRSSLGNITSVEELKKIDGLTTEKINRILLYLSFE